MIISFSKPTRYVAGWLGILSCLVMPLSVSAGLMSSFQAGDGDWHLGTLTVGNVDASPDLEIIVPYRNSSGQWMLDAFKWNGTRLPGFPYASSQNAVMNTSPTLADLNGDGINEIIFTAGASVIAMKGNGSILWSNSVNRLNYIPDSGYQVVTNGFFWSATQTFIQNLPTTAVFYSEVSPPIVADVEGRGVKEVLTAWKIDPDYVNGRPGGNQDYNPYINNIWGFGEWGTVGEDWSGGVVFHNASSGAKRYVYHIHQLVESGLGLGHADGTAPWDVYVLNDSDSVAAFDKTLPHGLWGRGTLKGQFGKNQGVRSGSYQQGVDVYPADIDGDGFSEVLLPTTQLGLTNQPNDTILANDGTILWRNWKRPVNITNNHGWLNSACMIPVNPEHTNRISVLTFSHSYDISFRIWNGVELVDRPGWPKSFYPYLPTPPVVGDIDGDGQQEIIIGTYDPAAVPSSGNLHIFSLDGTEKQRIAVPGGIKHIPSLADVNNDGSLDLIYRSTLGTVYVWNFGATSATNVSWATHRGNAQHDGNYNVSLFPPGTPLITSKKGGYRKAMFSWGGPATNSATGYRIYRADQPEGPFTSIVSLPPTATTYTDLGLKPGWQYIYEVAAVINGSEVHSAPFPVLSFVNNNLVGNSGMEENDNSHWDKWYSGNIDWTNMIGSTNVFYQGRQSMEIQLLNMGNNGSIGQWNQYGIIDATIPVTPGTLYSFGGFFRSTGITQPSEHWLQWVSSPTSYNTNNRPALPFPNYFTPHFFIGTTNTGWAYANRTFILPAGFPNMELSHHFNIANPGSGSIFMDNIFLRPLPAPGSNVWQEVVPFGSFWRYSINPPPANWYATNFDDSTWLGGNAKLGAGSGPTNIATQITARKTQYFFRRQFLIASTNLEEFLLSARCTDNGGNGPSLQMYLNGRLIPATDIAPVSLQGNDTLYYDLTPFLDYLVPGTNTVAIVLNNTVQSSWDDVAFDVSLKVTPGVGASSSPTHLSSLQRDPDGVTLGIDAPAGTFWRVESSDGSFISPRWQLVDTFTGNGSTYVMRDVGQNNRPPPSAVPSRFYRVVPY